MRAVVYDQPGSFTVRDVPTPEPGSGDVLVRMTAAGMCGTDLHLHEGQFLANFPLTPGHETVGEVAAVGADATDGDRGALMVGQQVV
ncbi:MAG: alcohol dehydrogenase catalytic domain-containing protein, partial [Actinomycetota bacterium]